MNSHLFQRKLKKKINELFCVVHLLLAWGLLLSVACIPSETPLEKTTFSFGSGYQLEISIKSYNFIGWLEYSLFLFTPLL